MAILAPVVRPPTAICLPIIGCPSLGSLGGDIAGAAAQSVFGVFTGWVADGASWLILHVLGLINAGTAVDVQSGWFGEHYQVMLDIGALVLAPMLGVATIGAILRQDFRRLGRVWAICLPVAAVGGLAAVEVTAKALVLTDQLSRAVTGGVGASLSASLHNVAKVISRSGAASNGPAFVVVLAALLVVAGGMLIWLELVLRGAAIYVALVFMPLALAGLVWPATSGWAKRLVETLFALVVAKFVIVTVLSLAVGAIGSGAGIDSIVTGGALLLLAAGAPFAVLRLVPIVEAGAVAHLEGLSRRPAGAALSLPNHPAARLIGAGLHTAADRGASAGSAASRTGSTGANDLGPVPGGQLERAEAAMAAQPSRGGSATGPGSGVAGSGDGDPRPADHPDGGRIGPTLGSVLGRDGGDIDG